MPQDGSVLTEDARRSCVRFAQAGRWHAAAEATIPCPQLPHNEETRERLEALHQRRTEAFPHKRRRRKKFLRNQPLSRRRPPC